MAKKKRITENTASFDNVINEHDKKKLVVMIMMAKLNISVEEYDAFLKSNIDMEKILDMIQDMPLLQGDDDNDDCRESMRQHPISETPAPMPDAKNKSLRIKVQMNDVSNPPMWRELIIPADFNFTQLHYAIQAVTGFDNSHLWMFQRQAYNPDLQIGIPMDDDDYGLEEMTHDADETDITCFLAKKGDKLEYVYDFGDDWIFTVSVIDVIDRHSEVAEMTKWKCEMQPIEDSGGIYSYLQLRDTVSNIGSFTKKEKNQIAEYFGCDDFELFTSWIDEAKFDPEYINKRLAGISDESD